MKYLIVLLVVAMVVWLLLRGRSRAAPVQRAGAPASRPLQVVACPHCGVHVPRGDGVEAADGTYCSEAHRLAGPRAR